MRLTTTIASAAVAGVLGLAGVSVAGAAATGSSQPAPDSAPTSTTVASTPGGTKTPAADPATRAKRAARRRHLRRRAAVIAARTIGIEPRALVRELRGGKTIAQVATEHGVQPQAVIDALEAAATARIDAARAAGKITADRAARLKQRAAVAIPRIVNEWHPRSRPAG
jgi:uncharacterized protein (DUF433 family)